MESPEVYFPLKKVFVWRPVLIRTAVVAVVAPLAALFAYGSTESFYMAMIPLFLGMAYVILSYLDLEAGYEKTRYEIFSDRIIHHTGGLLSDRTTNLPFRNVTQIEKTLPYLETKFFQTGHLAVHAAGSAAGKVSLSSVLDAEGIFERLEERLRENGFSLKRERMIQQEKPGVPGVIADAVTGKGSPIGFVVGAIVLSVTLIPMAAMILGEFAGIAVMVIAFGATITAGPAVIVVSFLDSIQRTYTLWDGMVEYEDGFLTTRQKIIPIANLADTNIDEPFLKRIFGMADMVVSCQGASGDIYFPSIPRAAVFRRNLDGLIKSTEAPTGMDRLPEGAEGSVGEVEEERDGRTSGGDETSSRTNVAPPRFVTSQGSVREFKPAFLTLVLPGWLLVLFCMVLGMIPLTALFGPSMLFPIGLLGMVGVVVVSALNGFTWLTMKYTLGRNSVISVQEVITNREAKEFTNDKITKIIARRGPIDRFLGTVSLEFHSIGSLEPIKFEAINDHDDVFRELSQRFGLPAGAPEQVFVPQVSLSAVAAKQIYGLLAGAVTVFSFALATLIAGGSLVGPLVILTLGSLLGGLSLLYDMLHGPRCRLNLFEHHVMVRSGLITDEYTYVAYHHARNVWSTTYPGGTVGEVTIDAGGRGAKAIIRFLENPQGVHDHLDGILYKRPMKNVAQNDEFETRELASWKPMKENALIQNSAFAALILVGIPLIPVVRHLTNLYYKEARCSLQEDRICQWRGIFFKRFSSVLINRIDQIQTSRGFLNNMLENGQVLIYTVGSGRAELILGPHGNHQEIYEAIQSRANRDQ